MENAANSSTAVIPSGDEEVLANPPGPFVIAMKRLLKKKVAVLAITYILVFYFCGVFAPAMSKLHIIPTYSAQDLSQAEKSPTWSHPFGTDRLGRDQLARVIWA